MTNRKICTVGLWSTRSTNTLIIYTYSLFDALGELSMKHIKFTKHISRIRRMFNDPLPQSE